MNFKNMATKRPRIDPHRLRTRMVERLKTQGVDDEAVLDVMGRVPRDLFVDEALRARAYELETLPLGRGQTISNPYTVARMTSLLHVEPGMTVLEIGTGSGYQAAVLAALGCRVVTVERLPELYAKASAAFAELGLHMIEAHLGDGTLGHPQNAPYARIVVTAGGPEIPAPLVDQLDEGGIMVIPVGSSGQQRLKRVFRHHGALHEQDCGPAVFVDLVGSHGWQETLRKGLQTS